jgi:hypothetical protein
MNENSILNMVKYLFLNISNYYFIKNIPLIINFKFIIKFKEKLHKHFD